MTAHEQTNHTPEASQSAGADTTRRMTLAQEEARTANAQLAAEAEEHRATVQELRESQEQLARQIRLFDTALSSIADYVFTCDLEGRITYANRARLLLWGKELPDVLGKTFFELGYPPELAARIHAQIETVISTGQPLRSEAEYTGASGMAGYYDYILVPVFGSDGQVELVTGSTRNITDRRQVEKALQASEEQSRDILESITDAFFALDRDWRFTYVNRQAELLLDRAPGDLLGKNLWEAYPGLAGSAFERTYLRAANERLQCSVTSFYPDHDRWYEAHAYPAHQGITIYFRDVSEQKRVEEERAQYVRHIQTLNERLQRAMRETHHRVKNNLQVISAMIEMQVMEHKDEQNIPLAEFVRLEAHVRTLAIVHDLLTTSSREEDDAPFISTRAMLDKLLPMLQQAAWKQIVRYSVEDAALTSKQCVALSLLINELVSNALKHGRKEAEVVFTVTGEKATLGVYDDGKGFPADFDPRKAANTGLELVDSLIRIDLRGQAQFGNRPQGGGQVLVTFPLLQQEE